MKASQVQNVTLREIAEKNPVQQFLIVHFLSTYAAIKWKVVPLIPKFASYLNIITLSQNIQAIPYYWFPVHTLS